MVAGEEHCGSLETIQEERDGKKNKNKISFFSPFFDKTPVAATLSLIVFKRHGPQQQLQSHKQKPDNECRQDMFIQMKSI